MEEENTIDFHIRQALSHLEIAMDQSIGQVVANNRAKDVVGKKWQHFLGEFMNLVREKGKQSRMNLLSWVSFPRLGK